MATLRRLLAAAVISTMALGSISALSDTGDDRAIAEQALAALPKEAAAGPSQDHVRRAKAALDRAARLRAAHDDARAKLAEGLAREWAEAAKDTWAAAEAEKSAAKARTDSADASAQVDRERALLEEGIAQAGRLRAQLESLDREQKEPKTLTASTPESRDAGPKAPAAKPDAGAAAPKRAADGGSK